MAKKLLLISPLEDFLMNPKEFPPLGILYLSSYLKQHGHEVDVMHGNPEDIKGDYDFYGVSSSTPQYPKALLTLQHIKQKSPNARVILGGPHTIAPKCALESLAHGFDQVVQGQGEKSLLRIIEGKETNPLVQGQVLDQQEIDALLPDRGALDMQDYGFPLNNGRAATIITARGCPYRCSFCSISCDKVRFRSPDKVSEELEILMDKYGFDRFLFLDDSFTFNKKRLTQVLTRLKPYNVQYRCYARSDNSSDEALLELMKDSGCVELGVGIESGSQKLLDLVNKQTRVEDNIKFIQTAQRIGIKANAFIMIGLPGESQESVNQTRSFMEQARPQTFGYNIFTPMPDSPIVVNYETPFKSGPYKGKCFKDFITLYEIPYGSTVTKSKGIRECFVSTPDLSREDILRIYNQEFEKFVQITGFDPRKRGDRKK